MLASLLACPVYLVFCSKVGRNIACSSSRSPTPLVLPRERRREALEQAVELATRERLEAHCLLAPTQWFNFFDFWDQGNAEGAN